MPNPLFAHASAHDFVCASGFAFALVEHCVSIIDTFDQSSAAANAGNAIHIARTKVILFISFPPCELNLPPGGQLRPSPVPPRPLLRLPPLRESPSASPAQTPPAQAP